MAFGHGSNSVISVDGTDISAYVNSVSMPRTVDTAETSTLGDDDKTFIAGLESGSFSLGGVWDPTQDANLDGTFDGATVSIIYGPAGSGSGAVRYTATCLVTNYSPQTQVNGAVTWTAAFTRTGDLTRDTYP